MRLQLRVKQPIENPVWVEVHNGDHLVARSSQPYARPGEIITVSITPRAYDEVLESTQLNVSVIKK